MRFAEYKNHQDSLGLLFWQVSMLWQRRIRQALQPFGITHTQFVILAVLEELSEQGGCVTQKRIADFSMIDVMTVSSCVRLLEKKGLIGRTAYAADSRANSLSSTETGRECLRQAVLAVENVDDMFFFAETKDNDRLLREMGELLNKNLP